MWFDTRPKLDTLQFTLQKHTACPDQSTAIAAATAPVDCLCSTRLLLIKVPHSNEVETVKELVSAFGDCTTSETHPIPGYHQLHTYFYDCRNVAKAFSLLPKFAECRDCIVMPVEQELKVIQIPLPPEISKEELWYEVSKYGDIAWSNCDRVAGKLFVSYLLFDIRCNAQLTQTPLMLNGRCLTVREMLVSHDLVCRQPKNANMTTTTSMSSTWSKTGLASPPILSAVPIPSRISYSRQESVSTSQSDNARKQGVFKILASPQYSDSTDEASSPDEYRNHFSAKKMMPSSKISGQLTPPLQKCLSFPSPPPTAPTTASPDSATAVADAAPGTLEPAVLESPTLAPTPPAGKQSNKVDLGLIGSGNENRTTVMLRNIPNKVNLPALRRFLDETNRNTYDFLYLRMDFNNKCNVGYAFINFTSPTHIATLTKARRGKKWEEYNSVKIIDISYANIQGRDALVDKFRDSPIMSMDPAYRPKLYETTGARAGQEQPFP